MRRIAFLDNPSVPKEVGLGQFFKQAVLKIFLLVMTFFVIIAGTIHYLSGPWIWVVFGAIGLWGGMWAMFFVYQKNRFFKMSENMTVDSDTEPSGPKFTA